MLQLRNEDYFIFFKVWALLKDKPVKLKGRRVPVLAGAQKHQDAEKCEPTFALAVLREACWIFFISKSPFEIILC